MAKGRSLLDKLEKQKEKGTTKAKETPKPIDDEEAVKKLQSVQQSITNGDDPNGDSDSKGDQGSTNKEDNGTSDGKSDTSSGSSKEAPGSGDSTGSTKRKKLEKYMVPNLVVKSETQVTVKVGESIHSFLDKAVKFYNMGGEKGLGKVHLQDLINNILEEWKHKNKDLVKQMQIEALDD